jgi:hypothetical protein
MATLRVVALAASIGFLLTAEAQGQQCLHRGEESAGERLRRQAAVDFVVELNAAQTRQQRETGRYASLAEVRQSTTAPLGFVPRLVVDQFGYMIKVTDALDPCGFALFSDERGVVFEALPTTLEPSHPRPGLPTEGPASKDDRTPLSDR